MKNYHEVREFSDGESICPVPYDNRFYLINRRNWTCRECSKVYTPVANSDVIKSLREYANNDVWETTELMEVLIPYDEKEKI